MAFPLSRSWSKVSISGRQNPILSLFLILLFRSREHFFGGNLCMISCSVHGNRSWRWEDDCVVSRKGKRVSCCKLFIIRFNNVRYLSRIGFEGNDDDDHHSFYWIHYFCYHEILSQHQRIILVVSCDSLSLDYRATAILNDHYWWTH